MNKWKKKCGIAIAIHSFIASEKYQLSIITGDHILVNEGNDDWLQGRNLFTHKVGIFPFQCVSFVEQSNTSLSSFLSQKSDLLIFEAEMTIRYAFIKLNSITSNLIANAPSNSTSKSLFNFENPSTYLNILNLISDVTSQIEICNNRFGNSAILAHSSLGFMVDNLREALGLSKNHRSLYSTMATISTWGRRNDPNNLSANSIQHLSIKSIDQPLIIHIHFEIQEITKPILCQFYLYDAINKSYLSTPTTLTIDPSKIQKDNYSYIGDLYYDNLEKKYMSNSLYLIIYTFDTKELEYKRIISQQSNLDDEESISTKKEFYTIRKCSSCVLIKLPELTNDSFGSPSITEAKSFTIKRGKFNMLSLPETISTNISLFQLNTIRPQESYEFDHIDEYEDHNYDNDINENDCKLISSQPRESRRYIRKTLTKGTLPPLFLDPPNINSNLSPPSSARTISSSYSFPNIALSFSKHGNQSFLVADALSKLSIKMSQYPLDFKIKITPHAGLVQDAISEEKLKKGKIISPLHFTSFALQTGAKSLLKIVLRKLKLDFYHKYSLIIVHLLDMDNNNYVECFQSLENPSLFNSESWICPAIKSGIQDQFCDFFSINLDSTNLPKSSLLLVFDVYKINTGFKDAKPLIVGYGLLPLFYKPESAAPQNEGEIIFYNCTKQLDPNEIVSTFIQNPENTSSSATTPASVKQRRSTTRKLDTNSNMIEFASNLKPIGSISYRTDSNIITQYINLFKLFHYHEYTNELKSLINNFMFYGDNQWLMYSPKILLNLCSIISSMGNELSSEAFKALQQMLSSLNMRFNDSLESLVGLFEIVFDQSNNSEFLTDLQDLADVMLPLLIDKLSMNPEINPTLKNEKKETKEEPNENTNSDSNSDSDHEFRDLIKTLPLFLQLVSRSYALKPREELKAKMRKIFDLLNQLLKRDVSRPNQNGNENEDDENQQKEAKIFMNQRLLLSHFWKIVDILPSCFDKSFATDIICNFIGCIRDDKDSLFAEKMKLLIKLSSKDIFWANNSSKNKLNDIFTNALNLAVTKPNCMNDAFEIMTGIMYSSNSRFVITFLPLLENLIDTNRYDRQLNYTLLTIAFNFPESFPLRILNKLVFPLKKFPPPQFPPSINEREISNLFIVDYDEVLKSSERLFIYMYVLFYQKDDIIKKFKYKIFDIFEMNLNNKKVPTENRLDSISDLMNTTNFSPDIYTIKYKLFFDVFYIIQSSQKPEYSPFDSFFSYTIYNFVNNFSVLTFIFKSFPHNQRLFVPMIQPLLHSMILYPSQNLAELFYLILKADIKLNKDPNIVKKETLNALWEISSAKYGIDGTYYVVKKEKMTNSNDEESFVNVIQKDDSAFERKSTFKKLYKFNGSCKEHSIIDLASTLFSKESIPVKSNTKKQSTPKYKKAVVSKEQVRSIIEDFADRFANLVRGIDGVRKLQKELLIIQNDNLSSRSELIANEDKLLESVQVILKASVEIKNEKFKRKMLEIICRFHLICGNNIEAAVALNNYLSWVPCNNDYMISMKKRTLLFLIGKMTQLKNNELFTINESSLQQDNAANQNRFRMNTRAATAIKPFKRNTVSFNLNFLQNQEVFQYNCVGGWNSEKVTSSHCKLNGRELHTSVLLKMIDLCLENNYESYANKFIDQLQTTCISKFRIIELMPLLCDMRRSIFMRINTRSVSPSNYFRVSFYGRKFDKFYQNRTFIYRRDYKIDSLNKFGKELKDLFPNAIIENSLSNHITSIVQKLTEISNSNSLTSRSRSSSNVQPTAAKGNSKPNKTSNTQSTNNDEDNKIISKLRPSVNSNLHRTVSDFSAQCISAASIESLDLASQLRLMGDFEGQFIIYQKAFPVAEAEINDPFYLPDDLPGYILELSGGNDPTIFRSETLIETESPHANIYSVSQHYMKLGDKHLPSFERRVEVDVVNNSTTRKLDPITYSILLLNRNIQDLTREKDRVKPFIVKLLQAQSLSEEGDKEEVGLKPLTEDEQIALDSLLRYTSFLTFLMQDNAPYWICYKDYFSPDYVQKNPNDKEKIDILNESFLKVKDSLENSILGLSLITAYDSLQKDFNATSQLFKDLENALSVSQGQ